MIKKFFTILIAICCVSLIHAQERKIPIDSLKLDLDTLFHIMKHAHADPFIYTKKNPEIAYLNLRERLTDSLTQRVFFQHLAPFYTLMHDAHCSITIPNSLNDYRNNNGYFLPFAVKAFEDELYIVADKDSLVDKGSTLIAINGIDVEIIQDKLLDVFPADGNIRTMKYRWMDSRFESHLSAFFDIKKENEVVIKNFFSGKLDTLLYNGYQYPKPSKKKTKKKKIEYFSLDIDEERDVATIKIKSFSKGKSYAKFLKKSFRKIKKSGVNNLVIDIRNNGGGYPPRASRLTRYISSKPFKFYNQNIVRSSEFYKERMMAKRKFFKKMLITFKASSKEMRAAWKLPVGQFDTIYYGVKKPFKSKKRFQGDVFVLMDGMSASTSAMFVNTVKQFDLATLIGEEAGGTTNGTFGNAQAYILPASKIMIKMPCIRFVCSPSFEYSDRGTFPDFHVPYNIKDYINKVDRQMEKVYKLIQEKKASH